MKQLMESLAVALSMYSRIPVPHIPWTKENMRYALCFFPVVGVAAGVLSCLWIPLSGLLRVGKVFRAVVLALIPVLVSGGIHLDGLLDTADALSSWQTRERRLEILHDTHTGSFAVIVCCCYLAASVGIWTEADARSVAVLAVGYALSRALSGFGICTFSCARDSGLAAAFSDAADRGKCRRILLAESAACMALMILFDWKRGLPAAAAAVISCLVCKRMAERQFGGITGDTQGFFLQVCELAMAFAAILCGKVL